MDPLVGVLIHVIAGGILLHFLLQAAAKDTLNWLSVIACMVFVVGVLVGSNYIILLTGGG